MRALPQVSTAAPSSIEYDDEARSHPRSRRPLGVQAGNELEALVAAQFGREVSSGARALSAAAQQRHPGTLAVVFYGSCLRNADDVDAVLDFYVLVDSYEATYDRRLLVWLNRLLPPNVFFIETVADGVTLRAKYAVVTLSAFASYMGNTTFESYFWGRFAQPCAVVHAASPEVLERLARALATAVETLVHNAVALVAPVFSTEELWVAGLSQSYATELRAEGPDRSSALYARFAEYYEQATQLVFAAPMSPVVRQGDGWKSSMSPSERARHLRAWRLRGWWSKLLSMLRVVRNGYTVEGGPEYLMWKIERHSDFRFDKDWRRKPVPLLALVHELWRAWRAGAFR